MMQNGLDELADACGILPEYYDISGTLHATEEDTKKTILRSMGLRVENEQEIRDSLSQIRTGELLEPVYIVNESKPLIPIYSDPLSDPPPIEYVISLENGEEIKGAVSGAKPFPERPAVSLPLPDSLPLGYHQITVTCEEKKRTAPLIVAPDECYLPEGEMCWKGLTIQLYALHSPNGFGLGDFSDLKRLIETVAASGVHVVGINPIHALYPANPAHKSPYSPSSRIYYNYAILDIESIEEFQKEMIENKSLFDATQPIDYAGILSYKLRILEKMFERFHENELRNDTERGKHFSSFVESEGESLRNHAAYELLYDHFLKEKNVYTFYDWPEPFHTPDSDDVRSFIAANEKRYTFFLYLQWLLHVGIDDLNRHAAEHGIILYFDLAVGVEHGGAEAWSHRGLFATGMSIGAPPDPFAPRGQNWGLAPLNPFSLRRSGYDSFIKILRKNMAKGGIIRIDHVMALFRLYWTENGTGAYIRYPEDELLAILALESVRRQCVVIGEDLGTVAPETRVTLKRKKIFSWKVLYFEKDEKDAFRNPENYDPISIATVNTHDLPTLKEFLSSEDIRLRERVFRIDPESVQTMLDYRAKEIESLRTMIVEDGGEASMTNDLDRFVDQIHRLIARSSSRIILFSLHDLLYDQRQPNLPGTQDEYPNWSLRYPCSTDEIVTNSRLILFLKELSELKRSK